MPPQLHLLDHAHHPAEGLWPEALLGVVALGHDLPALLGALWEVKLRIIFGGQILG